MKHSHILRLPARRASRFTALTILITVILASACHAAADASMPSDDQARNLPQLVGGIVSRSTDLTYITEQDSDVFVFYRNTQVKELTDSVLLSLLRRPPGHPVHQQSWSTFMQLRVSTDATGRWAILRQYLEANLTNLSVFRVPRDGPYSAQYDLYAVGVFNGNIVVGIQMFGVAT